MRNVRALHAPRLAGVAINPDAETARIANEDLRPAPVAGPQGFGGSDEPTIRSIADLLGFEHRIAGLQRLEHVVRPAGLTDTVLFLDEPSDVTVRNGRREELVDAGHDVFWLLPAFLVVEELSRPRHPDVHAQRMHLEQVKMRQIRVLPKGQPGVGQTVVARA